MSLEATAVRNVRLWSRGRGGHVMGVTLVEVRMECSWGWGAHGGANSQWGVHRVLRGCEGGPPVCPCPMKTVARRPHGSRRSALPSSFL